MWQAGVIELERRTVHIILETGGMVMLWTASLVLCRAFKFNNCIVPLQKKIWS